MNGQSPDLAYLDQQLLRIQILLERPAVQIQLLAIAIALCLGWLVSHWIWKETQNRFPPSRNLEQKPTRLSWREYGIALICLLATPVFSIGFVHLFQYLLFEQGLRAGLLTVAIQILRFFLLFRFFLLSLCILFSPKAVTYYRYRLFSPIFALVVIVSILKQSFDVVKILNVHIITLFDQSVTLDGILTTALGLYFWIVIVSLFEKIYQYFLSADLRQKFLATEAIPLLIRYFLIGFGVVLIFGYVGISGTALAAISGGLSVGIGFGLREVISNFVSGIWLLFEGALKPGDVISLDGEISEVQRLGVRATTIRAIQDNSEKIIPNQTFFTQNVTTLTGSNNLVYRSLVVGVSYRCDPDEVRKILLDIAANHPQVLKSPAPAAFFTNFGDSSLDFELKFWLDDPLIIKTVTSELACSIWHQFAENNIEIPYPQRDLHLRSGFSPE